MWSNLIIKSQYSLFALFVISIYFSTSTSVILSVLICLLWLFSGRFKVLLDVLKSAPIAVWTLLLSACLFTGLIYSNAPLQEGLAMVNKYRELFFISIFMSFLGAEQVRHWLWKSFIFASVVSLSTSFLMDLGFLDLNKQGDACFKSRITYSVFISFFAFFCAHKSYQSSRYFFTYLLAVVASIYNLFFVVQGRTGQMIIIGLTLLFACQRFSNKGRLLGMLAITVFLAMFLGFSDKATRLKEGVENTQAYFQPIPEQVDSSMGLRYGFWKNSLALIAEKPWFGHGTGSFEKEYRRLVVDERLVTSNPHNEFMMIGVQLGALGLLVYCGFLWSQFSCARQLPKEEKWLAQGLLLTLLITSLFNSPFRDHAEGHWFAIMIALCFSSLYKPSTQN